MSRPLCALSVASVLVLAACSPAADEPRSPATTATPSVAASDAGADTQTEGSDAAGDVSADDFLTDLQAAMAAQTSYEFTMSMGTEGEAAGAADVSDPANPRIVMTISASGMEIETRIVDGVVYMNLGALTGDKFIESNPDDPDNPLADVAAQVEQFDAAKGIAAMRDAVVSIEVAGAAEPIGGVEATPYTLVVDTTKLTGPTAEQLQAVGDALPTELTYTYWIGEDGLPYGVEYDVLGQSVSATYGNWGADVTVEAPSEDQISTESLF